MTCPHYKRNDNLELYFDNFEEWITAVSSFLADMSRTVKQPVGQKRLTNVAVVRLKKNGKRFEIACYKNKVLSWRSGVEKDIDEVLQTKTVFGNVSKGVLANSEELVKAFGTSNEEEICLEILNKGEVQVADKERESQLTNQFRDIAMIVMDKTVNPETQRPYTISMVERLMKEVHFAVVPHKSSKQQALELIPVLQKKFPITRAKMKLRLVVPVEEKAVLCESLYYAWSADMGTTSEEVVGNTFVVVCELEPGRFRAVDALTRELNGRVEVLAVAVQNEGSERLDEFDDDDRDTRAMGALSLGETGATLTSDELDAITGPTRATSSGRATPKVQQPTSSRGGQQQQQQGEKVQRCKTCEAGVGDSKQYREHFKSDWHKHNLKRRLSNLPPLSPDECLIDTAIVDRVNDLNDYSR